MDGRMEGWMKDQDFGFKHEDQMAEYALLYRRTVKDEPSIHSSTLPLFHPATLPTLWERSRASWSAELAKEPNPTAKKRNQLDQRGNKFWGPIELVSNHIRRLTFHQLIFFDIFK
jgi:hypothetical protein